MKKNKDSKKDKYFNGKFIFRCLFRICMIMMIFVSAILLYYESLSLCTLSEALTKNNLLSDFIAFLMLTGCIFFYFGYCHHSNPLLLFSKEIHQPFLYLLRLSIILLVILLVIVYDVENYFHLHYILMFFYVSITLVMLGFHSFYLVIPPLIFIPLLYLCHANLAVYEFLYILYIVIVF
uniref:Uncharacterized protein n=1 Tax=viral metagenome TaxID=1070528 RepID=A0A6C0D118_9ZZZZ